MYKRQDWSGIHSNIYQRNRNPNQMVLQDKLCALTGAEDGAVFASGVAALAAVFTTMLNSGDHAIVSEVCYSATNLLFREYLPKKYGVEVTPVSYTHLDVYKRQFKENVAVYDALLWKGIKEGLKIVLMVFGAFVILNLLRATGAIDELSLIHICVVLYSTQK